MSITRICCERLKQKLYSPGTIATMGGLRRAAVAGSIGLAAFGAAAGAYHTIPEFKAGIDFMTNNYPKTSRFGLSALMLGLGPDLMAQRFEGSKTLDLKRLLFMTSWGAISGGFVVKEFFKLNMLLFPENTAWDIAKRTYVDVFGYTPLNQMAFFSLAHKFVYGRPFDNMFSQMWQNYKRVLPANILVWGVFLLPLVVYRMQELHNMLYAVYIIGACWRSYLSYAASGKKPG